VAAPGRMRARRLRPPPRRPRRRRTALRGSCGSRPGRAPGRPRSRRRSRRAERQARADREAAFGPRTGVELAAEDGDPLPHADQPVAAAAAVARTAAVVEDLERELAGPVGDTDDRGRPAAVLERVRQRLLDDAVRRQVDAERDWSLFALDSQVDRQTGIAHPVRELVEVGEAALRRIAELLRALAEQADEAPHLDERLTPRLLDRVERLG